MPYRCSVDRGRLIIVGSREHVYRITDARLIKSIVACDSGNARCRTFEAHNFTVACGMVEVPWVEIAAALSNHRLGRATLDGGRLRVHPRPESRGGGRRERSIVFPVGYAPVKELGARVLDPDMPDESERRILAKIATTAVTGTMSASLPVPVSQEMPAEAATWATTLHGPQAVDGPSSRWLLPVSALALLIAGGLAAIRLGPVRARIPAVRAEVMRLWWKSTGCQGTDGGPDAAAVRELARIAGELLTRTEAKAERLTAAQPLKRVLLRECQRQHRRIDAAQRLATEAAPGWVRLRTRLQTIVHDLIRLGEIVDGAERSLVAAAEAETAPTSKRDAYDVLGVNPDVSERVLKKLVDALRACWHPDHARDEADRHDREARIKQINVAWDLITEKRQEA